LPCWGASFSRGYTWGNAGPGAIVPARYDRNVFRPLPDKPDHPALELEILSRWEDEGTFG